MKKLLPVHILTCSKSASSCSRFDFKNYRPMSVLPFLNKVFEKTFSSGISNFVTNIKLVRRSIKLPQEKNKQLMLYSNSPRSVAQPLIVNNT